MTDKQKIKFLTALVVLLLFAVIGALSSGSAGRAPEPQPDPTPTVTVSPAPTPAATAAPQDYVLNTHTRRFHYPDCRSVPEIAEKNREDVFASRDELLARGFKPCGNCHP